jgi:transcriptional regulator with XRE-family HTH domain
MDIKIRFGIKVKEFRKSKGLSQEKLAILLRLIERICRLKKEKEMFLLKLLREKLSKDLFDE